jgi:hypothetical protein
LLGFDIGSEILFCLMAIALSLTILTNHYEGGCVGSLK